MPHTLCNGESMIFIAFTTVKALPRGTHKMESDGGLNTEKGTSSNFEESGAPDSRSLIKCCIVRYPVQYGIIVLSSDSAASDQTARVRMQANLELHIPQKT